MGLGAAVVLAICFTVKVYLVPLAPAQAAPKDEAAKAKSRTAPNKAAAATSAQPTDAAQQKIVAVVNRQEITRDELAQQCLWHYGSEVLESLVNKRLILQHCKERQIQVTRKEVDEEIARIARRFGLPADQWLKMLQEERRITPTQYGRDIVWPTLALRKLAASRLEVTHEELIKAYETHYGPAVKARLIACKDAAKARTAHAAALKNPDDFGNVAKQYSDDVNSASAKGLIQPIRMHTGDEKIEQMVFNMKPGQVSDVIPIGDQFVILKCEAQLPAQKIPLQQVENLLSESIREEKLQRVANDLLRELQGRSKIDIVFGNPETSHQRPGVAAVVNGEQISAGDLAAECVERHGREVLEGTIDRRIIAQALEARALTVTQAEVDEEIARAALAMGQTNERGEPDVKKWLDVVTKEQGISVELYIHDAVWPSVALKKLAGDAAQVTDDDLKKGFEANYGPRVRCRAIVLNNQRKAQEVWEMARKNPSVEHFGDLAAQYSVEAGSRSLRGEVPPIQKHGGQPILEREAFSLEPGELSAVIQAGEQFVILLCEGHTQPTQVNFDEVRGLLFDDIHEKKLRIAMAEELDKLKEAAQVDNYLAQTSHSPKRRTAAGKAGEVSLDPRAPKNAPLGPAAGAAPPTSRAPERTAIGPANLPPRR